MVSSIPQKIWVAAISLTAIFILSREKYKLVEKFLIFLVFLMSLSFLGTLIIVKPDLELVFNGMIPSFPQNSLYLVFNGRNF